MAICKIGGRVRQRRFGKYKFGGLVRKWRLPYVPRCNVAIRKLDPLPITLGIWLILIAFLPNRANGWDVGKRAARPGRSSSRLSF